MEIVIFNNHIDFLKAMNRLQRYDKNKSDFHYISVDLNGIEDVRVEIDFIRRQYLLGFNGFKNGSFGISSSFVLFSILNSSILLSILLLLFFVSN